MKGATFESQALACRPMNRTVFGIHAVRPECPGEAGLAGIGGPGQAPTAAEMEIALDKEACNLVPLAQPSRTNTVGVASYSFHCFIGGRVLAKGGQDRESLPSRLV